MEYKWRVKKSERGMSLENFIYKQLGNWSHGQIKSAIDNKRAFINGRNVFISKWNVKDNDVVLFVPAESDAPEMMQSINKHKFVEVLFEDSYIIAVNKPPFIDHEAMMHSVIDYLGRRNKGQGRPYVGAMHRLDKETTGVMIFTKKKIANPLADQFREHRIRKRYKAILQGRFELDEGKIDKALEKGIFEEGKKVRVAGDAPGMRAITYFYTRERYHDLATLIDVEIVTGRTHQIRVHMADLGHPLVGDKIYNEKPKIKFNRQALHAEMLECWHPVTNQKLKIQAPLPADMTKLIDALRMGDVKELTAVATPKARPASMKNDREKNQKPDRLARVSKSSQNQLSRGQKDPKGKFNSQSQSTGKFYESKIKGGTSSYGDGLERRSPNRDRLKDSKKGASFSGEGKAQRYSSTKKTTTSDKKSKGTKSKARSGYNQKSGSAKSSAKGLRTAGRSRSNGQGQGQGRRGRNRTQRSF